MENSYLDNVIGVNEAARLKGLSPGYIKNLCAKGKIVSKKIGRTWIIDANFLFEKETSIDEKNHF